ncbi:uncharacterized protein LOC114747185 [Neltuma alba]|uniref:uncharacterized protein LOC114747185 n=1 Tax=Neltuma alba TaxID=207710 RepID=UPI0010A594EB|nr:uncharacterized protein LOC114747185 [Prosopis alba]
MDTENRKKKHNTFPTQVLASSDSVAIEGPSLVSFTLQSWGRPFLLVNPELHGDNNTRLFTFWTVDAGQHTGCYNLLCSGFIPVNNEIALRGTIEPLSVFGDNNSRYEITILIWKDPKQGDWWMSYGNDTYVGYWPALCSLASLRVQQR